MLRAATKAVFRAIAIVLTDLAIYRTRIDCSPATWNAFGAKAAIPIYQGRGNGPRLADPSAGIVHRPNRALPESRFNGIGRSRRRLLSWRPATKPSGSFARALVQVHKVSKPNGAIARITALADRAIQKCSYSLRREFSVHSLMAGAGGIGIKKQEIRHTERAL
jgi:hypothetical protein